MTPIHEEKTKIPRFPYFLPSEATNGLDRRQQDPNGSTLHIPSCSYNKKIVSGKQCHVGDGDTEILGYLNISRVE